MANKKSTAEKVAVMQAYLSGETLESTMSGVSSWVEWGTHQEPNWNWEWCDYRVKEEDYTLDIPWEMIDERWKWAAMDNDGRVYLYIEEPHTGSGQFGVDVWPVAEYASFLKISLPDTKHWDKTLTKRPEGV